VPPAGKRGSEELSALPRPVVTHDPDALFAGYRGGLTLILVLLAVEIAWFRYQVKQLAGSPKPTPVAAVEPFLPQAPISRPLGGDSVRLGPMVKRCSPAEVDCVPMMPGMSRTLEPRIRQGGETGPSTALAQGARMVCGECGQPRFGEASSLTTSGDETRSQSRLLLL
jgi:hypothetical protein